MTTAGSSLTAGFAAVGIGARQRPAVPVPFADDYADDYVPGALLRPAVLKAHARLRALSPAVGVNSEERFEIAGDLADMLVLDAKCHFPLGELRKALPLGGIHQGTFTKTAQPLIAERVAHELSYSTELPVAQDELTAHVRCLGREVWLRAALDSAAGTMWRLTRDGPDAIRSALVKSLGAVEYRRLEDLAAVRMPARAAETVEMWLRRLNYIEWKSLYSRVLDDFDLGADQSGVPLPRRLRGRVVQVMRESWWLVGSCGR